MGLESPTLTDSAGVGKALHYGLMPALDPWSTSRNRTMQGGRADRAELPRDWGLKSLRRSSLWDADHIAPVAEGGGECDLSNIRTLCLKCHAKATAALRERLRGGVG